MTGDLHHLQVVLDDATAQHHADLAYLGLLDPEVVDAIGAAHELPDPASDGLEARCV